MSKSLSTRNKALETLEPLANLLCTSHPHELFVTDPAPGKIVEGYSMGLECGNDNIIWTVKMGENCRFRSLMRARKVIIPSDNPKTAEEAQFHIDKVWRGQVCDELLALQSLGKLKVNWWEYPLVLNNDHGGSGFRNRGYPYDGQKPAVGAMRPGPSGPRGVVYVTCSPLTTRPSSDLPWEFSDPTSAFSGTESEGGEGEGEKRSEIAGKETRADGDEFGGDEEDEGEESDEESDQDKDGGGGEPLIEL